jgi:hypothetical protein
MMDISLASAAYFGELLRAIRDKDRDRAAEVLLSIPERDLVAIDARLRRYGLDPATLLAPAA